MLNSLIRTLQNMVSATASAKSAIRKEATAELDVLNIDKQRIIDYQNLLNLKKQIEKTGENKEILPEVEEQLKKLKAYENKNLEEQQLKIYKAQAIQLKPELKPTYSKELGQKQAYAGAGLLGLGTVLGTLAALFTGPLGWLLGASALGAGAAGGANVGGFLNNTFQSGSTKSQNDKALQQAIQDQLDTAKREELLRKGKITEPVVDEADKELDAQQQIQNIEHIANMLKIQGKTEQEILRYKIEQFKASNKIAYDAQKQLQITKMEYELEESIAAERDKIAEAKIFANIDKTTSILQIQGKTEQQILQYKISQYEAYNKIRYTAERQIEISKMQNELDVQRLKDVMEYSDKLEESVTGSISNIMSGTGNVADVFSGLNDSMIESYRKTASEGISDIFMKSTGIGDVFGNAMDTLKQAFGIVSQKIEDKIDVSNSLLTTIANNTSGKVAGETASGAIGGTTTAGIPSGLLGLGINKVTDWWYGVGKKTTATQGYYQGTAPRSSSGGLVGNTSAVSDAMAQIAKQQKSQATAGALTGGIEGLMTGYSAYQSAKAGGASQAGSIMSGVGAAGMAMGGAAIATGVMAGTSGTVLGLGASNFWNPVGWVLLIVGALLMIASLFMKTKKSEQTSSETRSTEAKVSSKIDITNKQLEIVNRNLVALKNTITTYILPSSVYFAEKYGLDEQFAVNSRRGLL
jgi:hypothetical protein